MPKRAIYLSGALSLVVVATAVLVGTAGATRSSPRVVPAVGVRLHADLALVGSASGSGRFDAFLVRTGTWVGARGQDTARRERSTG
jgi:hypothetical protein